MNNPFISVLIPTYNCAQYIGQAINSILAQDYTNLEIIVVDDGSTDNTQEIVETLHATSLHGNVIRYFHKEHSGISATRNFCLEKAQGELIAWLDSDDYWVEGKLKAQAEYMQQHPDCQIVFTKYENFIEKNKDIDKQKIEKEFALETIFLTHFPTTLIKKSVFQKCGNFYEKLIFAEDIEMVRRFAAYKVNIYHCLSNVFYRRRLHGENITLVKNEATVLEMNRLLEENLKKHLPENISLEKFQKEIYIMGYIHNTLRNTRNNLKNNKQ
jgi:glycosyltransferase involved in cell wall biosynthesis